MRAPLPFVLLVLGRLTAGAQGCDNFPAEYRGSVDFCYRGQELGFPYCTDFEYRRGRAASATTFDYYEGGRPRKWHSQGEYPEWSGGEFRTYAIGQAATVIGYVVIFIGIARAYQKGVTNLRTPFPESVPQPWSLGNKQGFVYGTFQCFGDCHTCLYGFLCPGLRAADTYQMTGVAAFWAPICAYVTLPVLAAKLIDLALVVLLAGHLGVTPGSCPWHAGSMMIMLPSMSGQQYSWGTVGGFDMMNMRRDNWAPLLPNLVLACYLAVQRQKLRVRLGGSGRHFLRDCGCFFFCPMCTLIQDARQVQGVTGERAECCCRLARAGGAPAVGQPVVVVGQPVDQQPAAAQVSDGQPADKGSSRV